MTQVFLLDALVEDLQRLFKHYVLKNSLGVERTVRVYMQDLPIREGDDEDSDPEAPQEPYIVVRLQKGELSGSGVRQTVGAVLLVCVFDEDRGRQGYRDALHIVNEIMLHYGKNGVVGRRYELQYPIEWAMQDDDTHPYYFAGVGLHFGTPAIFREVAEA